MGRCDSQNMTPKVGVAYDHVTTFEIAAAEKQSARADDRRVLALAPQVEPASFISKLFRFFSLPAVFVTLKTTVAMLFIIIEAYVV